MFTLIAENKYNEQLELSHNSGYDITEINGIDPAEAVINVTKNAGADGSVYNSAYVNDRQITITLVVNYPVESNRITLYQYFKPKFPVTLYFKNGARNVYISGYVQNVDVGFFDKKQTVQIVINCPQPYFNGYQNNVQDFANVEALFEFPFSIDESGIPFSELQLNVEQSIINNGDVETGAIIKIQALGAIDTPKIFNVETNEYMIINFNLQRGDLVTINTRRGEKAITLLREGVKSSLVGYLEAGSSWFQFVPDDNLFTLAANAGIENMLTTFEIRDQYEGV